MGGEAIFWLVLTVCMGVLEAATVNLASIWFVGGGLVAFIMALFGAPLVAQIIVFLAVSVALLLLFRKTLWEATKKNTTPTNADRFIGKTAMVTASIDNIQGTGTVKIGGMEWTARTKDGAPIEVGTQVVIHTIEGVTMYVTPAPVAAVAQG
ncbi:MAG: NfeD family protein [Eubacteriales bacterium]